MYHAAVHSWHCSASSVAALVVSQDANAARCCLYLLLTARGFGVDAELVQGFEEDEAVARRHLEESAGSDFRALLRHEVADRQEYEQLLEDLEQLCGLEAFLRNGKTKDVLKKRKAMAQWFHNVLALLHLADEEECEREYRVDKERERRSKVQQAADQERQILRWFADCRAKGMRTAEAMMGQIVTDEAEAWQWFEWFVQWRVSSQTAHEAEREHWVDYAEPGARDAVVAAEAAEWGALHGEAVRQQERLRVADCETRRRAQLVGEESQGRDGYWAEFERQGTVVALVVAERLHAEDCAAHEARQWESIHEHIGELLRILNALERRKVALVQEEAEERQSCRASADQDWESAMTLRHEDAERIALNSRNRAAHVQVEAGARRAAEAEERSAWATIRLLSDQSHARLAVYAETCAARAATEILFATGFRAFQQQLRNALERQQLHDAEQAELLTDEGTARAETEHMQQRGHRDLHTLRLLLDLQRQEEASRPVAQAAARETAERLGLALRECVTREAVRRRDMDRSWLHWRARAACLQRIYKLQLDHSDQRALIVETEAASRSRAWVAFRDQRAVLRLRHDEDRARQAVAAPALQWLRQELSRGMAPYGRLRAEQVAVQEPEGPRRAALEAQENEDWLRVAAVASGGWAVIRAAMRELRRAELEQHVLRTWTREHECGAWRALVEAHNAVWLRVVRARLQVLQREEAAQRRAILGENTAYRLRQKEARDSRMPEYVEVRCVLKNDRCAKLIRQHIAQVVLPYRDCCYKTLKERVEAEYHARLQLFFKMPALHKRLPPDMRVRRPADARPVSPIDPAEADEAEAVAEGIAEGQVRAKPRQRRLGRPQGSAGLDADASLVSAQEGDGPAHASYVDEWLLAQEPENGPPLAADKGAGASKSRPPSAGGVCSLTPKNFPFFISQIRWPLVSDPAPLTITLMCSALYMEPAGPQAFPAHSLAEELERELVTDPRVHDAGSAPASVPRPAAGVPAPGAPPKAALVDPKARLKELRKRLAQLEGQAKPRRLSGDGIKRLHERLLHRPRKARLRDKLYHMTTDVAETPQDVLPRRAPGTLDDEAFAARFVYDPMEGRQLKLVHLEEQVRTEQIPVSSVCLSKEEEQTSVQRLVDGYRERSQRLRERAEAKVYGEPVPGPRIGAEQAHETAKRLTADHFERRAGRVRALEEELQDRESPCIFKLSAGAIDDMVDRLLQSPPLEGKGKVR